MFHIRCEALGGRPQPQVTWWRDHALLDDTYVKLGRGGKETFNTRNFLECVCQKIDIQKTKIFHDIFIFSQLAYKVENELIIPDLTRNDLHSILTCQVWILILNFRNIQSNSWNSDELIIESISNRSVLILFLGGE